jgi:hypothetical protein
MSDEKNESRINIKELPQGEKELTAEEAQDVAGGLTTGTYGRATFKLILDDGVAVNNDGKDDLITG